jgi:hypothetical protein
MWVKLGWAARAAGLLGLVLSSSLVLAGKAHEHGVAKLDVGVEAGRIIVVLDTPLDNLVGFERAPRTDAERKTVDDAVAKLKDSARLFAIDGAAGCKPGAVKLVSAPLGLGVAQAEEAKGGHADMEAQFEFACADAAKARSLEQGLFEAFPRLKRIDLQVAAPRGQMKLTLRRPATRVTLAR